MKITQKQLLMLYQIAVASGEIAISLVFTREARRDLVDEILNQQDNDKLTDVIN